MQKSLWKVAFTHQTISFGNGVVIFDNGNITGGDSSFYYIGSYLEDKDTISATVEINQYAPGESIFGAKITKARLIINGAINNSIINFSGKVEQNPTLIVNAHMEKLTNLQ